MQEKGISDLWGITISNQQPQHTEETTDHLPPWCWAREVQQHKTTDAPNWAPVGPRHNMGRNGRYRQGWGVKQHPLNQWLKKPKNEKNQKIQNNQKKHTLKQSQIQSTAALHQDTHVSSYWNKNPWSVRIKCKIQQWLEGKKSWRADTCGLLHSLARSIPVLKPDKNKKSHQTFLKGHCPTLVALTLPVNGP